MTALLKPHAPAAARRLVTIASGKGGVGKTWLSIALAHALAAQGRAVLLFDGDLGLANVDIQLGLSPARDISQVILGKASIRDIATPYRQGSIGFDVAAGRSGTGALAHLGVPALQKLRADIITAAAHYDHVLVDLGAGIDQAVTTLSDHDGRCLVVMTAEPTSLTDAYAFIKLRHQRLPHGDIAVVVNNATRPEARQAFETLARACAHFLGFKPALAGVIRRDPHVPASIRAQVPIALRHPDSAAAQDVSALAAQLAQV